MKNSKGCGSAMRVAPIGLLYRDLDVLRELSYASSIATHGHPAAQAAAHAAALAVRLLLDGHEPGDLVARLRERTTGFSSDWDRLLEAVPGALAQKVVAATWLLILAGPGSPATVLMPPLEVFGMQNAAAPSGVLGSGEPVALTGSRKHARV